MKKLTSLFLAVVASVATLMASMPTSISEYTQEGITKEQAMSIPMTYLAFQVGCSSSSYIGVDMYAPSGKNYTIIGTSYTNWADKTFHTYQYFNPVSWCYSITTVENGYAFFDLQSVESGVWTLRRIQKYAGEWYYIPAEEENNEEPIVLNVTISQDCNLNGINESHATQNSLNGHSFVDLGLPSGLLWATCNVGSETPEQIGDYYAWGETQTKSNYSLSTYQYASNAISLNDISGTQYDAARVNWGGEWRMPSHNEVAELTSNCSRKDTTINGQSGLLLRGANGNYIFIPCAGNWCNNKVEELTGIGFWTSTATGSRYAYRAWEWTYISFSERERGFQIRPVISGGASLSTQTHTLTLYADGCENPNVYVFDEGQQVSISAIPQENNQFVQWSDGNTANPRAITMTQNLTLTAVFTAVGGDATGGIGLFSVSATQQVTFSPGNLQYQASTNTWRFADNQYDFIGEENKNISSTYNGWIDLFGWGTSGYDNTVNDPFAVNYQPWSTSINRINQTTESYNSNEYNYYGYGPSLFMSDKDLTGSSAYYDWGVFNAISNGGGQAGMWRTLTSEEWNYILNTRNLAQDLRSQATVCGVHGYVLLPDDFTLPAGLSWTSQTNNWDTNTYDQQSWSAMEAVGAVFLPSVGYRWGGTVTDVGSKGHFWSTSYSNPLLAYDLYFDSGNAVIGKGGSRSGGRSVRLVRAAQNEQEPVYSLSVSVEGEGTVTGAGEYKSGTTATLTATPASGYSFSQWSDGKTDNPRTITMTQDMTFAAVFAKNTFIVSFFNYDGTELQSSEVEAGTMPQYDGTEPTKPADALHTYTFAGWSPDVVAATGDATYTARFEAALLDNITLQENESADYYTQFAQDYNGVTVTTATLNRQFTQDKWATLCLPFNVNKAMMMSLGLYNRVFAFRYAQQLDDETIQVFFVPAQSIEAGKGYIVNPNAKLAAKTSFVFPNVTINTDSDNGDITALTGYNDGTNRGNLYLVGTLRTGILQGTTSGNTYLGLKDNQLYYPNITTGTSIRAYRGFFRSEIPVNASRVRIIADGEPVSELQVVGTAPSDWSDKSDPSYTPARKYIDNGILYIERNGITYTAQGHRLY